MLQELNKYAREIYGCGQPGGPSIRVLNERSVSDGGNLCPLGLVILKSVCIVSETPFSCDTVGREL